WARAQKLPEGFPYSTNGGLTRVENKLLDAMAAISSIPDDEADSRANAQHEKRAATFSDGIKEAAKDLMKLKPPSKIIMNELKRDLEKALEPTVLAGDTATAKLVTLRLLRDVLNEYIDLRTRYAVEMMEKRQPSIRDHGVAMGRFAGAV